MKPNYTFSEPEVAAMGKRKRTKKPNYTFPRASLVQAGQ